MNNNLIFLVSFFILSASICAQNKADSLSIDPEGSKASRRNNSKVPVIDGSKTVLPKSDSSMKNILTPQMDYVPKLEMKPIEKKVYTGSFGVGKVAEEQVSLYDTKPSWKHLNRWYRDIRGLRMFYDPIGGTLGIGRNANHRLETYISVGYQFNPIVFLGIGQGYQISLSKDRESAAPSFLNLRFNFLDDHTTPFFDLKAGYSFLQGEGFFINPNFGMSFAKGKRAWNINLGYSFQKVDFKNKGVNMKEQYHGISLRLTYEFSVF